MTRNQIIGAASSVFLLPSFILTVLPNIVPDPGQAVCNALGVIGLPFVPFALRRCREPGSFLVLIALGTMVLVYNFQNALDALNGHHAVTTGVVRDRMTTAAALNKNISDLDVRKGEVDAHKIVSAEAAQAAEEQRDHECGHGNGPKCRDLGSKLSAIKRDRGLTERAELIEREQDGARARLAAMGAIEKTADQTASQLAGFAGLFWSSAANSGETISTNRPIFKASVVEAMGGIMPWVLVTIFGTAPLVIKPKVKIKVRKGAEPPSKDSVLAWAKDRIVKREGRSIRAGVAFDDYQAWCVARGLAPVNIQIWGRVMKGELGFQKEGGDKRTSYVGISLKLKVIGKNGTPQKSLKITGEDGEAGEAATA